MNENRQHLETLQLYLDDYLVASDCLTDNGFIAQADAMSDMARRLIQMFCDDHELPNRDFTTPYVIDNHLIATDGRILVRLKIDRPNQFIRIGDKTDKTKSMLVDYLKNWDEYSDGEWISFPVFPHTQSGDDLYEACPEELANRKIMRCLYERIMTLPDPEYLDDVADYIGDHEEQPLRFRFRLGEGVVMPLKGSQ